MLQVVCSLNPLAVIAVAIIGFFLGGLWYSVLFGKTWMKEMNVTEEQMKAKGGGGKKMGLTLLLTVVSTVTLAGLSSVLGFHDVAHGVKLGLCLGIGIVAVRAYVNGMFQGQSCRLFLIVTGHDVVLLTVQAAILAVWR